VNWSAIRPEDRPKLEERLDQAWKTLYDHPRIAVPAIRETLRTETSDSFLIIDLCNLLLNFGPKSTEEVAGYFAHVDVNAHPSGTFDVTSTMAAFHCVPCLPSVARILELKDLDAQLPAHALPVHLDLGLIFTLGQYGDGAIPLVKDRLSSDNCVVRGNAALELGWLQPPAVPESIRELALKDSCVTTRARAWMALGLLDDPNLPHLAKERLHATPMPEKEERLGLLNGFSASFLHEAAEALESLKDDPDSEVRDAALRELEGHEELEASRSGLKAKMASISKGQGSKARGQLERAARKGRLDLGKGDPEDLLWILTPEDVPLLNRARAAVLNRLSDECLSEYFPLTYTARGLRHFQADAAGKVINSN